LAIKELCKEKGMKLADLASRLGINPVSFSQAMARNSFNLPYLRRIADVLEVPVWRLFKGTESSDVSGFVKVRGEIHEIRSAADLKELASSL